ncbi:hypothetical protein [Gimesia maris]|uniref:hypothetical protein n=1 Tax=Gimesia maris TaxID=122 RepID=UPI00241DDE20|nr:hypothetical protein [Gimesia maris]|tara:strand:- start:96061 stop:96735 length:675 start_codon:yes stop_codon:yes gene_type:complete
MRLFHIRHDAESLCQPSLLALTLATVLVLSCSSCAPIIETSLIEEGEAIEVPSIYGTWKSTQQNELNHEIQHEIIWTFTKTTSGQTAVHAVCIPSDSSSKNILSVTAEFTRLKDGILYAEYDGNLVLMKEDGIVEGTIPVRSIARISVTKAGIEITPLTLAWNQMKTLLIQEKVSFSEKSGRIHINSSREVLREFVTKHSQLLFGNNESTHNRLRKLKTEAEAF